MRHRYGSHFHQFGDLLVPDGDGPFPVAVLVHGGFWREQHTLELADDLARDLVRRGIAAWNIEFRRVGEVSGGGWPVTGEDVAAGDRPSGRARRAASTATGSWRSATPRAASSRSGPPRAPSRGCGSRASSPRPASSTSARPTASTSARAPRRAFLGGHADEVPDAYADASPIERLPAGVPVLIVHGDADQRVPVEMASAYADAARAAGDEVDLVVRPGDDHFVHLDPASGAWADVTGWLGALQLIGMSSTSGSVPRRRARGAR